MPHRLFLPKKNNRSKILSIKSLLAVNLILFLFICLRLFSLNVKDFGILGFATNIKINEVFNQTNIERQKSGLPPLKLNSVLSRAADKKAEDMFTQNYWAHIAPNGKTPWDFILGEDYKYTYAGENLAKDFQNSENVVKAWMNSPSHRDNILNKNYTEVGYAVVNGELQGKETTLVVQMFGTPYSSTTTAEEPSLNKNLSDQKNEEVTINTSDTPLTLSNNSQNTNQIQVNNINNVVTENKNTNLVTLNINIVKNFSYFLLAFFAISLFLDGYLAYKNKYFRVTGNTLSHLILFILTLIFIYYINTPKII